MSASNVNKVPRRFRPELELLEDRIAPTILTVINTLDGGEGSLRQAILDANAQVNVDGPDRIEFDIPGSGVHKIRPLSQLPTITDPVVIDGYTQGVATPNTLADSDNAVLLVHLDGASGPPMDALIITAGGSTVRGLVISRFAGSGFNFGNAITLRTGGGNVIEGCFIGTDPTGLADQGNGNSGIVVSD